MSSQVGNTILVDGSDFSLSFFADNAGETLHLLDVAACAVSAVDRVIIEGLEPGSVVFPMGVQGLSIGGASGCCRTGLNLMT